MKFEVVQKVEFSEVQIQKLLADFVKEHLPLNGDEVIEVVSKTGTRLVGHQMNEHEEAYFDGMTISFKKRID